MDGNEILKIKELTFFVLSLVAAIQSFAQSNRTL